MLDGGFDVTTLRRTNIYLQDEQVQALKLLAASSDRSVAEHVREAVDAYLDHRMSDQAWRDRFAQVVDRFRRDLPDVPAEEIEADITIAREEVRASRRAARGR